MTAPEAVPVEGPAQDEGPSLGVPSAVVLAVAGVVLALFGGFLQAWTVAVAGWSVPVGLVLTLATLVVTIRALVHTFQTRRAGVAFFVGWVVVSVLLALPTPGGDIVIAANTLALVYLFGGVVVGSMAANLPVRLRPAHP